MALTTYRAKRRFDVTSEPRGRKAAAHGDAYVIQKHAATRLHYDLRLELDGVMLSWAVTRGPSLVPGEKRLAVHVEDHPVDYNSFEGTIPKGEYGGGTVMIWDRGRWEPEGDPHFGYKKGHLEFALHGDKLKGRWHLVRMKKRSGERQEPWLLIKAEDEFARTPRAPDILEEEQRSAASGRTMEEIAEGKKGRRVWHSNKAKAAAPKPTAAKPSAKKPRAAAKKARSRAKKSTRARRSDVADVEGARQGPLPDFVAPCLARLADHAPAGGQWLNEIKFDGYRIQARIEDGRVNLRTRTGLDWTEKFGPIAEALCDIPGSALIDGEIVVETKEGALSFSALQEKLKGKEGTFVYYAFDLMHRDGIDLRGASLIERRRLLQHLLQDAPAGSGIRLSEHFEDGGDVLLRHACELGFEGIVAKRKDAPYRSGRGGEWVKVKCAGRQEFVVIGYSDSAAAARSIGSLILGYYSDDGLRYVGRVGTGFTQASARDLWKRLQPLRRKASALAKVPVEERGRKPVWVEPQLVAEINFRGWTHSDHIRHASFEGLRDDKSAVDVVREIEAMPAKRDPTPSGKKPARDTAPANAQGAVKLTNPNRVYWEDVGLTKQGLVDYYTAVWDWIAPYVTGRVLSLLRCPDGIAGQCFFQKHASAGLEETRLRLVPEDGDKVIAIDDLEGLLALVQAGVLEVHVRGSRIERLGDADRIVFDLDPAEDVTWPDVKRAATEVRARLAALKLESFVKTTGGKGLHVVAPIKPAPWDEVKDFTHAFAAAMAEDSPQRYIAVATKAKRKGRIFVDYLRNSREATAVCAYSTRARPGAAVSMPIAWSELAALKAANQYTVANAEKRLARLKSDPWEAMPKLRQGLPRFR